MSSLFDLLFCPSSSVTPPGRKSTEAVLRFVLLMKAIVYHRYGSLDVLKCEDIEKPTAGEEEVLIRVCAAAVNPLDGGSVKGGGRVVNGLLKPKITGLGVDVAGQVEAVGRKVTQFKPGDEVFGACLSYPHASGAKVWVSSGAFAEYTCASESTLVLKPDNVTFEQAASVPLAAFTALQGLRDKGKIQPGHAVLINGSAGGVGTVAVQIAKSFGAEVTGVCSTRNVDMLRSIGADRVIDYAREDFTTMGLRYDLFFDCIGNHSLSACLRVLNPKGIYVMVGEMSGRGIIALLVRITSALILSMFISRKLVVFLARPKKEDLNTIRELLAAGKVKPVIDRCYRLSEVPDAIRYLEQKHARGKVVITLE
jgi:NADPH:quinone reductase-like Zn-dependent oxidoreductase